MKKMILMITLIFILLSSLDAPPEERIFDKKDVLLSAVMYVESRYSAGVINKKENAVGILQIRPVMIREVNRVLKLQGSYYRFSPADRSDSLKSVQIWYIVQKHHNPEYDPMLACRIWCGGTKQYKEGSHQYWLKVKKQMDSKINCTA